MKGQVTPFIIIGIAVAITLGLSVFILNSLIPDKQIQTEAGKTGLRNCIENAAEVAIADLGLHGGTNVNLLAESVPASKTDPTRVRWGVKTDAAQTKTYVTLEPLCLIHGSNAPSAEGQLGCSISSYQSSQPDENVIQYALTTAISENLKLCGIEGETNVTLGKDDVIVQTVNATAEIRVRLQRVYDLAQAITIQDRNPNFNKKSAEISGCDETDGICLQQGLVVRVLDPGVTSSGNYYSIVQIVDSKYKIDGKPFIFQFAVQDRKPVVTSNPPPPIPVAVSSGNELARVVVADPDEDEVTLDCIGAIVNKTDLNDPNNYCATANPVLNPECRAETFAFYVEKRNGLEGTTCTVSTHGAVDFSFNIADPSSITNV